MTRTPTQRIADAFGWPGFPPGLFYCAEHGLRFDLGGELDMGPSRFLQAVDRARAVARATFEASPRLTAVVSHLGGERRDRRRLDSLRKLREMGFPYALGEPDRIPQHDEAHIAEFGGDLCEYVYAVDFPNDDNHAVDVLLWASVAREMRIAPRARWIDGIHIVDFDRRIALTAYDDLGMDAASTDPSLILPLYRRFGDWLLEYDRDRMDAAFGVEARSGG